MRIDNPTGFTSNLTGSFTGSFFGDGSGLTGTDSGSWDGQFTGSAGIQGSLEIDGQDVETQFTNISSNISDNVTAITLLQSEIQNTGSWDGIFSGSAEITGSLRITGSLDTAGTVTSKDLNVVDAYANDPLIKLATNTSGNAEVQIRTATTTYNPGIGIVTSGFDFNIFTNNTPRLTISSGGNVGIGISPTAKLHIQGTNSSNGGIKIQNSGGNPYGIYSDNNDLLFTNGNGATTALTISYGGTTTIDGNLRVEKSLDGDPQLLFVTNPNSGTATEAAIYVGNAALGATSATTFMQTLGTGFSSTGGFIQDGSVIGTGTDISGGLSLMVRANADMRFYTNGHTNERMRITDAGTIQINSGNELRAYRSDNARYGTFYADNSYVHIAASTDPIKISSPSRLEFHTSSTEAMRLDDGYSVSAPNLQWTTLFDIGVKLSSGSTAIVTVYASSGSGLGMATLLVMRDGYGSNTFTELGTQPTATYLGFRLNPSNLAQLQVQPSISSGNHTIKGKLLIIKS